MTKARVNGKRRGGEIIEHEPQSSPRYSDLARARMPDNPDAELFDADLTDDIQTTLLPGALQSVLTELGAADDDAKVTVNKLDNINGQRKVVWLMETHPSAFNLSDIQDFYGPGDYQIVVYGKQPGSNYKVIHANKRVTIGASRNPKNSVVAAPGVTVHGDGSQVAEAIAKALAGPLAGMTALMQTMMQKQGGSRAETLNEVKELMAIMGAGAKQTSPMEQLMMFKAFKDLFGTGGGEGGTLDSESGPWAVLMKSIESFGGPLAALAQAKLGGAPAEPAPVAAALHAPVVQGAALPVNNPDEGNVEMALALKLQVSILFNAAKTGADTVTYSSLIYEQAPDAVLDVLESPAWFEELCKIEPAFKDFKPWADKCRAEVIQALAEDAAEAGAGEVAGNSTGDVAKPLTQAAGGAKTVADGGSTPVR